MTPRLKYHFEPKKGWINDPNGLIFFKGQYHAFFQHNPHEPKWGPMHWGHAVSDDLVNWTELPIALYPDMDYEDDGGCFSGSAMVKDDKLYLFYTSVSKGLGQTQSVVTSTDGITFVKYENNPVIKLYPTDGSFDFRDPKVTLIEDKYHMVCGSGKDGCGKILRYTSTDLLNWEYAGVLFEGEQYGGILECPDFFPFEGKYLLMFSQMGKYTHATHFVYGDFDGTTFTPISEHEPEAGPQFYAPQTFLDDKNRRIIIAWLYDWNKKLDDGAEYAGAFTIPREITLKDGKLRIYPVKEAQHLLTCEDELVSICGNTVTIDKAEKGNALEYKADKIDDIKILRDTKTIEVFINQGEASFTYWFAN